jgi:putative transcriptional regulator
MVRVHLAILLAKKKWKLTDLQRATNIRYMTLSDLYHEMALGIKFEHIQKICEALDCKVEDLIEYIPKKKNKNLPD